MKLISLFFAGFLLFGCNRPSDKECQRAHENIKRIEGTAEGGFGIDVNKSVRSCRGTADRKRVLCVGSAQTKADLAKCYE